MSEIKIPTHMKAAVLWNTGEKLVINEGIEIPELKSGQVLIKMAYSGVCRSQLMEVMGHRGEDKYLPHLLGHEGCGQVIHKADDVSKVSVGDWTILGWIQGEGKNAQGAKYKLDGKTINSGPVTTFSTYSIVSENRLVLLPKGISKDIAVLFGCALPTGAGIVLNEIQPEEETNIGFIGMGGIGLSALMASASFNCKKVIAIDVSDTKLELSKEFGATHTINSLNQDVKSKVYEITNGEGLDYAIEAAGRVETIELAFELVKRKGGNCVFASHPEEGKLIRLDPFELINGKNIKGSWGGASKPDKDVNILAELYNQGMMPLEKLITKTYTLEEINLALDDLKNSNVCRPVIIF